MSCIEVNIDVLHSVAKAIDDYCDTQDLRMESVDRDVRSMLIFGWVGKDAREFRDKWDGVNSDGSTAVLFRESLKDYAEALVACAEEYRTAQVDSVNAAGNLMRRVGR
jgi:uncharacterized protein YukE